MKSKLFIIICLLCTVFMLCSFCVITSDDETTSEEEQNITTETDITDSETETDIIPPNLVNNYISTPTTASESFNISGLLQWKDDNNVNHPLRRVMVKIYDKELIGETLIATTYTDNSGRFSYMFDNPDDFWEFGGGINDIFIRIYAGDSNAMVKDADGNDYYYEPTSADYSRTSTTVTCNSNIGMSNNTGRALQISQAILTARDYAWEMMGEVPSNVTIKYPYVEKDSDECCYYSGRKLITITGANPTNTMYPNSYASWDTIMHEYGHHIQYEMNIIDNPSVDTHYYGTNHADDLSNKDAGIRLAWGEAWPTVFGLMAQQYYSSYLQNIETVTDTYYTAYNGLEDSIEDPNIYYGDACELSIMAVLWDLYDSVNDDADTLTMGHSAFWFATTSGQCKTFSEFVNDFYDMYPGSIYEFGKNLTYYHMAAAELQITNSYSVTVPPIFYWSAQGGSLTYPNNSFVLIFFDINGNEIFRTSAITNAYTLTLTQSEWDSILYSTGTYYYTAISATQTNSPTTGAYISDKFIFNKPSPDPLTKSINIQSNSRYVEDIKTYLPGQYAEYTVTFATGGIKLFQTFGAKNTFISLIYNGNTVASNDNSGYEENAFLYYSITANVEYTLRIEFLYENEFGSIKLSITPASETYTHYENIWNQSGTSVVYEFETSINTTRILTFTPTVSGEYTFEAGYVGTRIDTYLYIIDPQSTNQYLYNDDAGGDLQAKITTNLISGRRYFIVISPFNITNTSGTLTLDIYYSGD